MFLYPQIIVQVRNILVGLLQFLQTLHEALVSMNMRDRHSLKLVGDQRALFVATTAVTTNNLLGVRVRPISFKETHTYAVVEEPN